jgi:hypothetical protein
MDHKTEIIKTSEHVVIEWIRTIKPGDIDKQILPVEAKSYYTLSDNFIPAGTEIIQNDRPSEFNAYDVIAEEVVTVSLNDDYYYGVGYEGIVGCENLLLAILRDELPDLTLYIERMTDKIDTFKYRFNTILTIARKEWESSTIYELIDIAKNEYGIDVHAEQTKTEIIDQLTDIFTQNTMAGSGSVVESRTRTMEYILELAGVEGGEDDRDTLKRVCDLWLSVIREYRNKALIALDKEEDSARENDDDQGVQEVVFIKQLLRDLPEEVLTALNEMDTCFNIVEYWPPLILPRPTDADIKSIITVEHSQT